MLLKEILNMKLKELPLGSRGTLLVAPEVSSANSVQGFLSVDFSNVSTPGVYEMKEKCHELPAFKPARHHLGFQPNEIQGSKKSLHTQKGLSQVTALLPVPSGSVGEQHRSLSWE